MNRHEQATRARFETLAAFRYALRRFIHFSEEAAQAAGITAQQYQALLAIKGFPGRDKVTVGELAERLQLRHHSAVGLMDRLVTEKLAIQAPSATDRRRVLFSLRAGAKKLWRKSPPPIPGNYSGPARNLLSCSPGLAANKLTAGKPSHEKGRYPFRRRLSR